MARTRRQKVTRALWRIASLLGIGLVAVHPIGRFLILPFVILAMVVALMCLIMAVISAVLLHASGRDRRVRVIRGLEHACLAILRERGYDAKVTQVNQPQEFRIVVDSTVSADAIADATREAVQRFSVGITKDAYSTSSMTSAAVTLVLTFLLIGGCVMALFAFGVSALIVFIAYAVLGWVLPFAARPLGVFVQRRWTVSTQFTHVDVGEPKVIDGVVRVPIAVTL